MLLQQSGSDFHRHSYSFEMTDSSRVGEVRRFAHHLGLSIQLDDISLGRVAIAINELGNNLVKYAKLGRLIVRKIEHADEKGIEILSVDHGPGMDPSRAVTDGFTTGSTPGTGLGAVQRQSTYFDIFSSSGKGTVIVCGILNVDEKTKKQYSIGAVNIPLSGETVSGDDWCVHQNNGILSVLMVDGLGHGNFANAAAREAVSVFSESLADTMDQLLMRIHGRLKSTRGGAIFLVQAENQNVSFMGVGNIRALILKHSKSKSLISQNGTAGVQLRRSQVMNERWEDGLLVLHSDGINSRWDLSQYPGLLMKHPAIIAAIIARDFSRGSDDASVLVIGRSV